AMILAKSRSSFTTFSTNVATCFSSTKSRTATGRSSASSIFHARNVLLMRREDSDSCTSRHTKSTIFTDALPAGCTDFSDALLVSSWPQRPQLIGNGAAVAMMTLERMVQIGCHTGEPNVRPVVEGSLVGMRAQGRCGGYAQTKKGTGDRAWTDRSKILLDGISGWGGCATRNIPPEPLEVHANP